MGTELNPFPNASEDFKAINPGVFGKNYSTLQHSTSHHSLQSTAATSWRDFEESVIKWLKANGWTVAHFRPAKTEKGWRTAVSADGKGFPDILALKDTAQLILETKTGTGKASPEQVDWMLAFQKVGVKVYLVTPENWEKVRQEIETE